MDMEVGEQIDWTRLLWFGFDGRTMERTEKSSALQVATADSCCLVVCYKWV